MSRLKQALPQCIRCLGVKSLLLFTYLLLLFLSLRLVDVLCLAGGISQWRDTLQPSSLSSQAMKDILEQRGVAYQHAVEKSDLVHLVEKSGHMTKNGVADLLRSPQNTEVTFTNFNRGVQFYEKVMISAEVWLAIIVASDDINSYDADKRARIPEMSGKSWSEFRRRLSQLNIRIAILDCSKDRKWCKNQRWSATRFQLFTRYSDNEKSNILFRTKGLSLHHVYRWILKILQSLVTRIFTPELLESKWLTFRHPLQWPDLHVVILTDQELLPPFILALSAQYKSWAMFVWARVAGKNSLPRWTHSVDVSAEDLSFPVILAATNEGVYVYGQNSEECYTYTCLRTFLHYFKPTHKASWYASFCVAGLLALLELVSYKPGLVQRLLMNTLIHCVVVYAMWALLAMFINRVFRFLAVTKLGALVRGDIVFFIHHPNFSLLLAIYVMKRLTPNILGDVDEEERQRRAPRERQAVVEERQRRAPRERQAVVEERQRRAPRERQAVVEERQWRAPRERQAVVEERQWRAPRERQAVVEERQWRAPRERQAVVEESQRRAPRERQAVVEERQWRAPRERQAVVEERQRRAPRERQAVVEERQRSARERQAVVEERQRRAPREMQAVVEERQRRAPRERQAVVEERQRRAPRERQAVVEERQRRAPRERQAVVEERQRSAREMQAVVEERQRRAAREMQAVVEEIQRRAREMQAVVEERQRRAAREMQAVVEEIQWRARGMQAVVEERERSAREMRMVEAEVQQQQNGYRGHILPNQNRREGHLQIRIPINRGVLTYRESDPEPEETEQQPSWLRNRVRRHGSIYGDVGFRYTLTPEADEILLNFMRARMMEYRSTATAPRHVTTDLPVWDFSSETPVPEGFRASPLCVICQDDFCQDDKMTGLLCEHIFHHACLVRWLNEGASDACPICRS